MRRGSLSKKAPLERSSLLRNESCGDRPPGPLSGGRSKARLSFCGFDTPPPSLIQQWPGQSPRRGHQAIDRIKNRRTPLLGHPERRTIATGTFVVQNSGRLVIVFLCISHQQTGQIVENEPLFVIIDRDDHMVKTVASIVHGHELNVVCGEPSRSSRRIFSDE